MDFEKAFKIYQVNCDTNSFPNSCGKAGYYLCTGDAGEHDPVCFKKYLFCNLCISKVAEFISLSFILGSRL